MNTGRRQLALALMFASGLASLGYQIVWTRQCAVWLGHETAAVLAVVAAFFGGLAVGAHMLGARIERSACPVRWYAACELVIALWSVALAFLIEPAGGWLVEAIGAQPAAPWHWALAFLGTFGLLLPATAAMGATLPAMERVTARLQQDGHVVAALYAANTLGAVAGVLGCAFWLVPTFGLAFTASVCAAVNVLCAATVPMLGFGDPAPTQRARDGAHPLLALLALTGLLGIGYEVLVVRVLSQVAEDTVYTFAMLLAVYLAGTAFGAAAYQRWAKGASRRDAGLRNRLLLLLAGACLVSTAGLWQAENLKATVLQVLVQGMPAALAAEAVLAVCAFALPTLVMGALFSHLAVQARDMGIGLGRVLAANTVGAAGAPIVFGVILTPLLGLESGLLLVACGYMLLMTPNAWRAWQAWIPAAGVLAVMLWMPPLQFVEVPHDGRIVSYREGAMAAVSVVEDAQGTRRLRIDNRQQEGSNATRLADARQALLPLLLHVEPRRALFLGLGTGVTAHAAAADPALQVDAVELLPEVVAASADFARAWQVGAATTGPKIVIADARRFVRASTSRYDVIVSDNFHPARSGSGALYTVEHFQAVKARLNPGGVFCQWLPLHQLDLASLRSIVRSFLVAYPDARALIATNSLDTPVIGLIGHDGAHGFDADKIRRRLSTARPLKPEEMGFPDEFAVLGSFIAGPRSLARFAGSAPANTDDRPVVAYGAPRLTYAPDSQPRDRLFAVLAEVSIAPGELLVADQESETQRRMAAYWQARLRFLQAGRDVRASGDVRRMLAQVREPLLSILRISADFRPAYDPLLRMAVSLAQGDAEEGRRLLAELATLQPSRPEARDAMRQLDAPVR